MQKDDFQKLVAACRAGEKSVQVDSRKVGRGDIFVAMPGSRVDGAEFIGQAAARGASAVVCEPCHLDMARNAAPACDAVAVEDSRKALGELAKAQFHTDRLPLKVIGITGTNGKTTCAWLLEHLFSALGHKCGVLGTVDYRWPGHREPASLTTPGCLELHSMLARMRDAGADMAIMEVSSHALALERIAGLVFAGAIFTNLTQDHLDFHRDMEDYYQAKARLFLELPDSAKAMAINYDDAHGRRLCGQAQGALTWGLSGEGPGARHLGGEIESLSPRGMRLAMMFQGYRWRLETPLVGAFNAANLLAVQALALALGLSPDELGVLASFRGVPGRLERVAAESGLHIFVDYAHTPDALENALRALRGAGFRRIVTVFGCGGNRDRGKRPLMGEAVARNSDIAVLTSDNPRNEEPLAIMEDVRPGLARAHEVHADPDRRAATAIALKLLRPGDALLIAGKGHEDYQIVGNEKHHYSDQETVRELLGCG